ncbi:hypothetical protein PHLGIDRAFT_420257 [Phlebiopsis gigantea 11061_1 CR5-6]|uniref:Zn(2)-C6 fungal-type domain-containing protein n=1 Tax=Phlebiopsis gigantea (strain 11061_1 CR5-6) TaxID=745531 RepID=A0A0C3PLP8_PHLG1|nr:hypothetical protein PHLGIDRAFT_420257 [Phlebiopsis gigantea 11061_1 CR5-6]
MSSEIPSHLARGKACVPCRRRKMKCDGNQPTCNQCARFNRPAECQFSEGPSPSTTRVLETHVTRLQSRIQELEQDDPSLVRLHDPYQNYRAAAQDAQPNWWETPDPPVHVQQTLVQSFLPSASKFGFFLDATRFVNLFVAPTPARPRPPTVLRNVVYLWGITLSQDPQYTARESLFLGRTLRSVHAALSTAQEQQRNALYILQAEILLAYYFFHSNRLLEGKFHASAAVSLAILCNLHKVMSGNGRAGGHFIQPAGQAYIPLPADHIDEAERIFAWWATFILDRSWVVALAAPAMISETQELSTVIDTPWPLTVDNYAQHAASARPNLGSTVQRFLADVQADSSALSPLALIAKASALYDRANYLASYLDRNAAGYENSLLALDDQIEKFKQSLPSIERASSLADERAHSLLLVHCLVHSASIQLHRSFATRSSTSMMRCLTSANTIVRVMQDVTKQVSVANPIIGVLTATAGEVLLHGLRSLQTSRTAWASSSALPGEERFVQSIRELVAAMQRLAQSPFIAAQTAKFREASSTL